MAVMMHTKCLGSACKAYALIMLGAAQGLCISSGEGSGAAYKSCPSIAAKDNSSS
jgi:hypothetical protein